MKRWRNKSVDARLRRGLGIALLVEISSVGLKEYARVERRPDGRAIVYSGAASIGQGLETVLAQICADELGVAYDKVTVRHGDTSEVVDGVGSFGSRGSTLGGGAVALAARRLRERFVEGTDIDLVEEAWFVSSASFPYGVHCAAVEVDTETGGVRVERYGVAYDVGRAINPLLVEGQLVGGVAQGLGGALLEEFVYDDEGQLAAGSLVDYLLPTATDVPPVDVLITEDAPTPRHPLGAKGAGEGGVAGVGAAIANAVSDALGVEVSRLPLSPERVVALAAEQLDVREGRRR